jgi:signal transduction histidine kinase
VLYRVAQEAISNALRHSGSPDVWVRLSARPRSAVLEVGDHGSGFEPADRHGGVGLNSMRERAKSVAGTLTISSRPGAHTTVRLSIPVPQR